MTRYADPRRCPDCLGQITYGALNCPTCGLALRGDTAQRLFTTLSVADETLARLRAESDVASVLTAAPRRVGASVDGVDVPTVPGGPIAAPYPAPIQPARTKRGLSAASVPKILLTLGAGCVLVAALVFLAIAWSVMGVNGRTATLVGFTAVASVLTSSMARRGLRGAAEALSLVTLGLLTLDTFGARHSGWFGDISDAGFLVLLGSLLAVAGAAAAVGVRRTKVAALTGSEIVSAFGLALVSVGLVNSGWFSTSAVFVVAVLVTAAATLALHGVRLEVATAGAAFVTGATWLLMTGQGLERAVDHNTLRGLWVHLEAWPTLVAAAMVAALAGARALPVAARVTALSVAQLLVAVLVVLPADSSATQATLAVLGVLLVVASVTAVSRKPWWLAGTLSLAVGAAWLLGVVAVLVIKSLSTLGGTAAEAWDGTPGGQLVIRGPVGGPAPWLLPVALLALVGIGVVLARLGEDVARVLRPVAKLPVGLGLALATSIATVALYRVPVWVVLLALLAVAVGLLTRWLARPSTALLSLSTGFLIVGVLVSAYDEWLTGSALVVTVVLAAAVHLRAAGTWTSAVAGSAFVVAVAGAVWTYGVIGDVDVPWLALTVLLICAIVTLGGPYLPATWWASDSGSGSGSGRDGIEAGAALTAFPVALAGVVGASFETQATWAAVYLTVAGVAVSAISLLRGDRLQLSWVGGALLAVASWVRLWDVGVHTPEAYTLPSALALTAVGVLHLRRHPASSTMTALAAGLGLALVPSLLWVLYDPASIRSLLLGLGCLALLVAGLRLHWSAPIVLSASVGALVVLRLAAPFIDSAVPRWVLIGMAGAVLIAMGATWERRLQEARTVMGAMRGMR